MQLIRTNAASVAELLRATRGAAGYSSRELAALIGVSHGTISNWENARAEPSISQFIAWADATGQPADELLRVVAEIRNAAAA